LKILKHIAVLLCATSCLPLLAQHYVSGNDLLLKMDAPGIGPAFTMGYVTAVADAMGRSQMPGLPPPKADSPFETCFVVPRGVIVGQLVDVVRVYLEKNPNRRHFPAAGLVGQALQEAYPCK
jgi:hypothetical protein